MKKIKFLVLLCFVTSITFAQQTKLATIRYDIVRETGILGRKAAEGTEKLSNTITEDRFVYFKDTLAYYERTKGGGKMFKNQPGVKFKLPFEEYTFTDMKNHKEIISLTVLNESNEMYYSVEALPRPKSWKDTGKTQKMLGLKCYNAKVVNEMGEYDIWYTKELDFNFSPLPGIQPAKGLVLKIEGPQVYYNARIIEKKLDNPGVFNKIYKGEQVTKEDLLKVRSHSSGKLRPAKSK